LVASALESAFTSTASEVAFSFLVSLQPVKTSGQQSKANKMIVILLCFIFCLLSNLFTLKLIFLSFVEIIYRPGRLVNGYILSSFSQNRRPVKFRRKSQD
jgi:hypothetical protein